MHSKKRWEGGFTRIYEIQSFWTDTKLEIYFFSNSKNKIMIDQNGRNVVL